MTTGRDIGPTSHIRAILAAKFGEDEADRGIEDARLRYAEAVRARVVEEIEWATGLNGETVLEHLADHGLTVVPMEPGP